MRTPLEFLLSIQDDDTVPLPVRMRAAIEAAQYMHPKLSAVAKVESFASEMERIGREQGRSNVIDARPIPQLTDPSALK